jgi:dienelactone hydrolase
VDVAPLLASAGYRVIVPYVRGYGTTRFLSSATPRNGQQSVVAVDAIALIDALKIQKAIIGGFDWGARTANIIAATGPERCKAFRDKFAASRRKGMWMGGTIPLGYDVKNRKLVVNEEEADRVRLISDNTLRSAVSRNYGQISNSVGCGASVLQAG